MGDAHRTAKLAFNTLEQACVNIFQEICLHNYQKPLEVKTNKSSWQFTAWV